MENKDLKDLVMHKVLGIFRRGLNYIGVAAISCIITYIYCNVDSKQKLEDLNEQIKDLQAKEQQSKVIQRTSEQMEDIAYQQKEVSDRQRERAEHESHIADMERDKAEIETNLAEAAKRHAILSAMHADSMTVIARNQSNIAVKNMQLAENAKAQSDTLFYNSLSTSLAQSALTQKNADNNLSNLLAYASWHYATRYNNTINDGNVYKALLQIPENTSMTSSMIKGAIRGIDNVTVDGNDYVIAISDYGEIAYIDNLGNTFVTQPSVRFYRDMAMVTNHRYAAITADGIISLIDYEKEISEKHLTPIEATLPNGIWTHIVSSPDNSILTAMTGNMLIWLSADDLHIIATATTDRKITAMGYAGSTLHVFGDGNTHYISNAPGTIKDGVSLTDANSPTANTWVAASKHAVSAYVYDKTNHYYILGYDDGDIEYHNINGALVRTLSGHHGAITHLDLDNDMLMSSSYDCSLRFWFVNDLTSLVTSADETLKYWPYTFVLDRNKKVIWIGMESGNFMNFSYSIDANATETHKLLKREFTKEEWNYYIGPSIPYRTFMGNSTNE